MPLRTGDRFRVCIAAAVACALMMQLYGLMGPNQRSEQAPSPEIRLLSKAQDTTLKQLDSIAQQLAEHKDRIGALEQRAVAAAPVTPAVTLSSHTAPLGVATAAPPPAIAQPDVKKYRNGIRSCNQRAGW